MRVFRVGVCFGVMLVVAACGGLHETIDGVLTSDSEEVVLPKRNRVLVQLEDHSDAQKTIAEARIANVSSFPIHFRLRYSVRRVTLGHRYVVTATIEDENRRTIFASREMEVGIGLSPGQPQASVELAVAEVVDGKQNDSDEPVEEPDVPLTDPEESASIQWPNFEAGVVYPAGYQHLVYQLDRAEPGVNFDSILIDSSAANRDREILLTPNTKNFGGVGENSWRPDATQLVFGRNSSKWIVDVKQGAVLSLKLDNGRNNYGWVPAGGVAFIRDARDRRPISDGPDPIWQPARDGSFHQIETSANGLVLSDIDVKDVYRQHPELFARMTWASPDARWFAFADKGGQLGMARSIFNEQQRPHGLEVKSFASKSFRWLSWAPNSRNLALGQSNSQAIRSSLYVATVEPDQKSYRVSVAPVFVSNEPESEKNIDAYRWSPDGQHLLYQIGKEFFVYSVVSKINRKLEAVIYRHINSFHWNPQGTRLAYHIAHYHRLAVLSFVNDSQGTVRVVTGRGPQFLWSPDGDRIAYFDAHTIKVVDLDAGEPGGLGQVRSVARLGENELVVQDRGFWSPDGKRLAYVVRKYGDWSKGTVQVAVFHSFDEKPSVYDVGTIKAASCHDINSRSFSMGWQRWSEQSGQIVYCGIAAGGSVDELLRASINDKSGPSAPAAFSRSLAAGERVIGVGFSPPSR